MTPPNYYLDSNNEIRGPIDRMPPEKEYKGHPPACHCTHCEEYASKMRLFLRDVIKTTSHPHTFTGQSRVVPEGEIEWEYYRKVCDTWIKCTRESYLLVEPEVRRRVATPKITEEGKGDVNHGKTCYCNACASKRRLSEEVIPAHIVDDMKLDSYYDGFKDGAKITGEPDNPEEESLLDIAKSMYESAKKLLEKLK